MRVAAYALGGIVAVVAAGTAVWVWRGERWLIRSIHEGVRTADSADTHEYGMQLAMTAGAGVFPPTGS